MTNQKQSELLPKEDQSQFPVNVNVDLPPEAIALLSSISDLKLVEITIKTPEEYEQAVDTLQSIKGLAKSADETRKGLTKPFDNAKKVFMDYFKPKIEVCGKAEALIKQAIIKYNAEQEKIRIKAEAAAEEKARKQREKLEERADKAAEKGNDEKSEALQTEAAMTVAETPAIVTTKVSGVSQSWKYTAEVPDLMALVKSVAEGKTPINAIQADTKFLNNQAKALKENFEGMYAGCKIKKEPVISSRSK